MTDNETILLAVWFVCCSVSDTHLDKTFAHESYNRLLVFKVLKCQSNVSDDLISDTMLLEPKAAEDRRV